MYYESQGRKFQFENGKPVMNYGNENNSFAKKYEQNTQTEIRRIPSAPVSSPASMDGGSDYEPLVKFPRSTMPPLEPLGPREASPYVEADPIGATMAGAITEPPLSGNNLVDPAQVQFQNRNLGDKAKEIGYNMADNFEQNFDLGSAAMGAGTALASGIANNENGNDWANTALDMAAPALLATGPIGAGVLAAGKLTTGLIGQDIEKKRQANIKLKAERKELQNVENQQMAKFGR